MSRAAAYWVVSVPYSVLAPLPGTFWPVVPQMGLLIVLFSPRSVRAMMLRVFEVVAVLLVTQISTRRISMPVVMFGRVDMAWS